MVNFFPSLIFTFSSISSLITSWRVGGLWVLGIAATALGLGDAVMLLIRRWFTAHATIGVELFVHRADFVDAIGEQANAVRPTPRLQRRSR